MSSEKTASAVNILKGDLAAGWNLLEGSSADYTDLGIARRFGGAAAAYSLRDIGAMNRKVVNVRREPHDDDDPGVDDETDFSANQVQSGVLEDWVNGKLEDTLPADVATAAAAYSLRKVSSNSNVYTGDYSSGVDGIENPAANSAVTVTGNIDGISDGSTSKDNVLKIENNATVCPQLSLVRDNYQLTRSGQVTFTYYVPSGHPIIGKFWQIGSHDAGANSGSRGARIRTNIGVQIVGGAWTTITLSYGSQYGGTDKFTDAYGSEFITITNEATPNVKPFVEATANDGDIYYISAISVSATPLFPLRIRRSSDEVEVNVAFDSDDKISNSSLVENETEEGGESGRTTATTLAGFLSEERTTFVTNPNFSAVSNVTLDSQTITNTTASITFSGATGNGFIRDNSKPANIGAETGDTVSFDVTASGLNAQAGIRIRVVGSNTDIISPAVNDIDNGTQNVSFTVGANSPAGYFAFTNLSTASSATITVSNLKVVGKSAFVHTWYDQAGSNNAVQDTDANQPKIASSGALLADGLDFDGSNDFLQTSGQVLTNNYTGARSLYGVCKINTDSGYIFGDAGNGTDEGTSFYSDTASDKIFFTNGKSGTLTAYDNITTTEGSNFLISSNYNNNNTTTIHKNSHNNGYVQGTGSYNFGTSSQFTIGDREGGSSAATRLNGSIKEIIAYDSDQSANRFKIESNINNYYGLYNDEVNFTSVVSPGTITSTITKSDGTTESASTSQTVTTNSKNSIKYSYDSSSEGTGNIFTRYMLDSSSDFIGLAENDTVQVSVFVEEITSGATLKLILNDNYTALSDEADISSVGFHSVTLTRNSTSGTEDNLQFKSLGLAGAVTISVKDIKASRIARNGFVETWYDQSANIRDAIQGTATNQPSIVQNGGIVKVNSKPAITFDGNDNFLEVDGTGSAVAYSFSPSGDMGMFIVSKQSTGNVIDSRDAGSDGIFLQQASSNTTRFRYNGDGSIDITATRDAQHFSTMTLDSTTLLASVDGGTAGTDTVTAGISTTHNLVLGAGFNDTNFTDGEIQEAIFYENNKTSDKSDIETDIDNFYSIK